ncbi:glycosyltransferase family 4 protein [Pedobacter sp.]|uniref:glycosyltransferase family 4 protein n=1 Tax=Pedobacter sp. TaxID=1411316 RepID=UPI0031DE2E2D
MPKKLAIISTHPIQYYAPVFQLLAKKTDLMVFYTAGQSALGTHDKGFNKIIKWDLPLLEGYACSFVENTAKNPGSHHFNGVVNPALIKEVQSFNPDFILVYGWAYRSHLKLLRFFKGKIPVCFRGDSTLLNTSTRIKNMLRSLLLKWIYKHVDLAFYVGTANKAYFKAYGLKEQQLHFAPHAIDNERFAKNRLVEAVSLRAKLSIGAEELLILFAGKFDFVKNPALLLDAFIDLNLKSTHLLFIGNGELERILKEKVEGLSDKISVDYAQDDKVGHPELEVETWNKNVKSRIHFMEFQNQSQMPIVYQACDLFCLPSVSETWGLAVNEAMAAGKAILVSDKVGCADDLVKPEVNGSVFKSGDLADLKQKLKALTENKAKLTKMGMASKQIIQEWSFEKQVTAIVDALENKHAK